MLMAKRAAARYRGAAVRLVSALAGAILLVSLAACGGGGEGPPIITNQTQTLFVTNLNGNSVTSYPAGSSGNVTPLTDITGFNTLLNQPNGVAFDTGGNFYVPNFNSNTVTVYFSRSTGNVSPSGLISGAASTLDEPSGVI